MGKTQIEWVKNPDGSQGFTLNSKTGCTNHTPEGLCLGGLFPCYADKLANGRLKPLYVANKNVAPDSEREHWHTAVGDIDIRKLDPFYPRFWEEKLKQPYQRKKPAGIFLDDMSDWMLDCWPREWTMAELQMMRDNPQHRIYTLTKQPQNLIKFSPFPDNCWVGVTATNANFAVAACYGLQDIEAKVKFLSIEPLLAWVLSSQGAAYPALYQELVDAGISWLIIGACTGSLPEMVRLVDSYPCETLSIMRYGNKYTAQPPIQWLREIVEAATKTHIPIFEKDNLSPLLEADSKLHGLRQEMPE